ncbi:MAG: phosphoribosylamine--glycine ligase [Anaerolineae bacterium]
MRILVVGSGGREHALTWKLMLSRRVDEVFVAPGNGGTGMIATNVAIDADDVPGLAAFARDNAIDLTVVGPEVPLVAGLVDAFEEAGLRAFGPTAAAARLEGSKAFAKEFMRQEGIPTAPAGIYDDYEAAREALAGHDGPIVVKASGLAAGKGVLICDTQEDALAALHRVMVERAFGAAGDRVLLEERLEGEEMSLLAFTDGKTVVPMLPARDYKRALDGDRGLNTGGMGGYAPSPFVTPELVETITRRVLQPAVDGMRRRGTPYVGVLYAGLMLTDDGPHVLEFNARFGDPETQLLLPLLQTDLVDIMEACLGCGAHKQGQLASLPIRWRDGYNVGVVLASGGYPARYEKGKPITGLDEAAKLARTVVFHAGTRQEKDRVLTDGGRVLTVTALGSTLEEARSRAYSAVGQIRFDKMQYRTDIAILPEEPPAELALRAARPSAAEALSSGIEGAERRSFRAPQRRSVGAPQRRSFRAPSAYAQAGVDIDAGERTVALMREAVRRTYTPDVLGGIGAFGGSLSVAGLAQDHDLVLVASTDGVGTKTMIAEAMGIYDTIGHDIVNHCVNDVLVQGARPLFFLDYIAAAKLEPEKVATVVSGCAAACSAVNCVLIGGETAEMPGVYHHDAFDLVGTIVGWVDRAALIDGSSVEPGDVCLGIPSSGLHTNGFSLARKAFADVGWDSQPPELDIPLGEALLRPHRAYLQEVETLWEAGIKIKAMSHITGGAYVENLPRVLPDEVGARIDRDAWEVPPIFRLIQKRAGVDELEMYRVYNMGIGLVLVVPEADVDRARAALPELVVMGETTAYEGIGPRIQL